MYKVEDKGANLILYEGENLREAKKIASTYTDDAIVYKQFKYQGYKCSKCNKQTVYSSCDKCNSSKNSKLTTFTDWKKV